MYGAPCEDQTGLIDVCWPPVKIDSVCVMVPTLRTIMNSSYYYEYWENIHLGVKSTPA